MSLIKGLFLVLLSSLIFQGGMAEASQCVRCHEALKNPPLKVFHREWRDSVHAQNGITCEYCHGGAAEQSEKQEAHRGVYGALNPKSSIFYNKIPALCGGCHKAEFNQYKTSSHFKELMTRGVGPHCVTCHDAMSTKVVKPEEIELFCATCHNTDTRILPTVTFEAKVVLEQITLTEAKLKQAEQSLERADQADVLTEKAKGFLQAARHELFACKQDWHAFQLARVSSRLQGVERLIEQGIEAFGRPQW